MKTKLKVLTGTITELTYIDTSSMGNSHYSARGAYLMKKQHIVRTPCTLEQGQFAFRYGWTKNKQEALKEALYDYNSARVHDGQEPTKSLPRGTTIEVKRG